MRFDKLNSRLRWGIIGGIIGGLIAIIGFWILSPPTDSVVLFVILRVIIGSIVAAIIGPIKDGPHKGLSIIAVSLTVVAILLYLSVRFLSSS